MNNNSDSESEYFVKKNDSGSDTDTDSEENNNNIIKNIFEELNIGTINSYISMLNFMALINIMDKKIMIDEIYLTDDNFGQNMTNYTSLKENNNKIYIEPLLHKLIENNRDAYAYVGDDEYIFEDIYNGLINEINNNKLIKSEIKKNENKLGLNGYKVRRIKYNEMNIGTQLKGTKCPFADKFNKKHNIYVEITKNLMALKCNNKNCFGKIHPNQPITININITNNNTTNNNNNYYNNSSDEIMINDKYIIFDDIELNNLVMKSLNNAFYDIAKVVWYLNKNLFNCTDTKIWYMYNGHLWIKDKLQLLNIISEDIPKTYETVINYYNNLGDTPEIKSKIRKIEKIIIGLKTPDSKNNIMIECGNIFYINNKNFLNKLDTNPKLIGFNNGIYDLELMKFRPGKFDDYVSFSVGYDYIHENISVELKNIIKQIIPNKQFRKYILTLLGSCLLGTNELQEFYCFNGKNNNEKFLLIEIIKFVFGQYCDTININNEFDKEFNKKKIVFLQDERKVFSKTILEHNKLISLCSNCSTYKLILLYKTFPIIDFDNCSISYIWKQLKYVNFVSSNNSFNMNLLSELKLFKMDIINLFIKYYKKYKNRGLPDINTLNVKEIRELYMPYINKFIIEDPHKEIKNKYKDISDKNKFFIIWTQLKQDFNTWWIHTYHENPPIDSKLFFESYFNCKVCNIKINDVTHFGWKHYRIPHLQI